MLRFHRTITRQWKRPINLFNKVANNASFINHRSYATYRYFNDQQQYGPFVWSKKTRQVLIGTTIVGGIIYVSNLDEAPYSHRRRFIILSPKVEQIIGEQGYRETMQQFGRYVLPDGHPDVLRVKRIMNRLIKTSDLENNDWRIHVINDPKAPPNAFVLPTGKVFVFTSILPICKNDDGLATVLAHETGHQVARHTAENLSRTPIYMILGIILYTLTGSDVLNSLLVNGLFQLPASRTMEREADYIGLMMMSKACFNPSEAVNLWQRMTHYEQQQMAKQGGLGRFGGTVPEFLSTHPSSGNRIELIKGWLSEANAVRAQQGCDEFTAHIPQFSNWLNTEW